MAGGGEGNKEGGVKKVVKGSVKKGGEGSGGEGEGEGVMGGG